MSAVEVIAKLYTLRDHFIELTDDDQQFIADILSRDENGKMLSIHDILRIVSMQVPGEVPSLDPIWKEGTVSALRKDLDKVVWRYMPLEALFFLLSTKTLHFSPLSAMADTTEGQLPPRAYQQTKTQLPQHVLQPDSSIDPDTIMAIMIEQRRTDACASCWYMAEIDDIAMWRKYAPRNGVAIRTTVARLCSSLGKCKDTNIHIGGVTYYGPTENERYTDQAFYGSLFIKHYEFRQENELRALAYRVNAGRGLDIPVDLEILIERLMLSPELPEWAVPSMSEAISHLCIQCQIDRSQLRI